MTEILQEKLLRSSFTFGFELEGCAHKDYFSSDNGDYTNSEGYDISDSDESASGALAEEIETTLNKLFNCVDYQKPKYGSIEGDCSIDPDDSYEDVTFEWASPVMECTPTNFNRTIKMLYNLRNKGIYTNESCGFHHHLSWDGITERDMIWVYLNLCLDINFRNSMKYSEDRSFTYFSERWSDDSALNRIADYVHNHEWSKLLYQLSDDKYRQFRIHPYGTIEWRGPRDFLNEGHLQEIKNFYKQFIKYIDQISKYEERTTLFGTEITREELFKKLTRAKNGRADKVDPEDRELEFLWRTHGYHDRPLQYRTEHGAILSKNLIYAFKSKPELFYNILMEDKISEGVRQYFSKNNSLCKSINERLYNEGVSFEKEYSEKLFQFISSYNNSTRSVLLTMGGFAKNLSKEFIKTELMDKHPRDFISNGMLNDYVMTKEEFFSFLRAGQSMDDTFVLDYINPLASYMEQHISDNVFTYNDIFDVLLKAIIIANNSRRNISINPKHIEQFILNEFSDNMIKKWNDKILAILFNQRVHDYSWGQYLIVKGDNIDIKSLIALVGLHPDAYQKLPQELKTKINPYIGRE